MIFNPLKINDDKMISILMHSKFRPHPSFEQTKVGNDVIPFSTSASSLSVVMDKTLAFPCSCHFSCLLSKLQSIQNSAARIVTLSWKYDHFTPLLIQLRWLPVRYRIVFKILLIVYKSMNGDCPSYLPTILLLATLNI